MAGFPRHLAVGLAVLWLVAAGPVAGPAVAAEPAVAAAPGTLRLDYFHTGGRGQEIFSLDRVVVEPLPWPGSPAGRVDTSGAGHYRFEVRSRDGELLYSRGFSSIFAEWLTTAEARDTHRTFHESLRFPEPPAPVRVLVQKRDAAGDFATVWETSVDPGDMFVDRSAPAPQTLLALEANGPPATHVDLLLLGDGYTAGECAAKFPADARRMTDALFAHEPFRSRRTDFNVWGLCPPAVESGVTRPSTGVQRATPAGTTYDALGSERYLLTFDNRALRGIASRAPYEFLAILANAATYGGGGIHGQFATVAVDNDWADYVFVHEFGHHFAALADEYYTSPVAYEPRTEVVEPWEANVTALLEPGRLKWRELVDAGTPLPTPWPKAAFEERQRDFQQRRRQLREQRRPEHEMSALFREERDFTERLLRESRHHGRVGAFQGANYDAQAYYRPEADCVMFTRDRVPFCRVCRGALGQVIDLYAAARPQR